MNPRVLGERSRAPVPASRVATTKLLAALPSTVHALVSGQPALLRFLLERQRDVNRGSLSAGELSQLAKGWRDNVPERRGASIVHLRDVMQAELDLGLPKARRRGHRRNRRRQRRTK